jgi:5-methylcytosine-specific restriction enzyme A
MLDHKLRPGQIISNDEITKLFKVGNMGGMRRSHATNSLVLISDHTKGVYDDRWENNICFYTGMGLKGDQLLASQNKTLYESDLNAITVYLFEVHIQGNYRFHGQVKLYEQPFQDQQIDAEGIMRKVWIFPLILVQGIEPASIPSREIETLEKSRAKNARRLCKRDLDEHIKKASKRPGLVQIKTTGFYRNQYVAEYVRRRAKGRCELCAGLGPFLDRDGLPFLEVHHVKWLSDGGEDTIFNTVALCPNCHRKMHLINSKHDVDQLLQVPKLNNQTT